MPTVNRGIEVPTLIVPWPTDHHAAPLRAAEAVLGHDLPPLDLAQLPEVDGTYWSLLAAAVAYVKSLGLPTSVSGATPSPLVINVLSALAKYTGVEARHFVGWSRVAHQAIGQGLDPHQSSRRVPHQEAQEARRRLKYAIQ